MAPVNRVLIHHVAYSRPVRDQSGADCVAVMGASSNLARSKAAPGPLPKSRTITMTDAGNGSVKVTIEGVAGDGSKVSCSSTYKADGKDYSLTGTGCPGGGDTISVKSVNANRHSEAFKKGGKIVQTTEVIVAADGKSRTSSSKGTGADGKPTSSVYVYDKQ